jgi:hypothetical protein
MGKQQEHGKLIRRLQELGCTVELGRKSGHYKVRRDGQYIYTLPGSCSDNRGLNKAKAHLRRIYGLDV